MLAIFLDIETNGLDPSKHQPLEIAFQIVDIVTNQKIIEYSSVIKITHEQFASSSPGALKVNGFTWEEIVKGKEIGQINKEIKDIFQTNIKSNSSVFICQNPSFDKPFFNQIVSHDEQENFQCPHYWLDLASMYWAKNKDKITKGLSKDKIANSYQLLTEEKPHRAQNGVRHLIQCYQAVNKDEVVTIINKVN